jgi:hypothetical protein
MTAPTDDYLYDDNGDKVYKDGTGIHKNPDGTDGK